MKHVVMFSGGIGSWAAAKRVVAEYGAHDVTLLFTDTLIEDEDLYRFLREAVANVLTAGHGPGCYRAGEFVHLIEGRTPWQVYRDERFLGNSRIDPCSKILKRQMADRWLRDNCDPADTTVYVGIDWSEEHRYTGLRDRRAADGWTYKAPLCDAPYISKADMYGWLKQAGIRRPRMYDEGFAHNNCGGECSKAGQGHWALMLVKRRERYMRAEGEEQGMGTLLGKPVSMLTDRRGDGKKKLLTLRDLRIRIEGGAQVDAFDIGGCGCFADESAV